LSTAVVTHSQDSAVSEIMRYLVSILGCDTILWWPGLLMFWRTLLSPSSKRSY